MHATRLPSAIAVIILIMVGATLLSSSTLRKRSLARQEQCANNLKRLSLGVHNYHSAYKQLPPAVTGTVHGNSDRTCNQGRLSGFAGMLPFIEQQAAWEALVNRSRDDGFPMMGPAPSIHPKEFELWGVQFDRFLCPDEDEKRGDYGMRSYLMCYGDGVSNVGRSYIKGATGLPLDDEMREHRSVSRGAFSPGVFTKFRDILDGLSNTIMLSETVVEIKPRTTKGSVARNIAGLVADPSKALKVASGGRGIKIAANTSIWTCGKGSRWPEGTFILNGFTTVLPPNSPSATEPQNPFSGCVSASSHHKDSVTVVMCDGAVRTVSNSIDCGDLTSRSVCWDHDNAGSKSPYGVWGAMGTRATKEVIPSEREADFKTLPRY